MKKVLSVVLLLGSTAVMAKPKCMVSYDRTACAGQEEVSYKKCKGKKTCEKKKSKFKKGKRKGETVNTLTDCQEVARLSCANSRFDITKSKVITATWDGKAIKSAEGDTDFCLKYENVKTEFNQCEAGN
jgi:hypothetical protein